MAERPSNQSSPMQSEPSTPSISVQPAMVELTDAAATKIATLILEENNPNLYLRVYITGGGCSGYQYGFSFDETIQSDDTVISKFCQEKQIDVRLLVDCMSITLLTGAEIDYTAGIQEQFVIRNPNAKTTCGCGSSFSIEENED